MKIKLSYVQTPGNLPGVTLWKLPFLNQFKYTPIGRYPYLRANKHSNKGHDIFGSILKVIYEDYQFYTSSVSTNRKHYFAEDKWRASSLVWSLIIRHAFLQILRNSHSLPQRAHFLSVNQESHQWDLWRWLTANSRMAICFGSFK